MSDLISRQAAIEAVYEALRTPLPCYGNNLLQDSMTLAKAIVNNIPSAEPERQEFEWCHDCKEYDQEKHCCHRWTKVIRQSVEEMKAQEPERKRGTWLWKLADNGWADHICSECGWTLNTDVHVTLSYKFCPRCGADMRGEE